MHERVYKIFTESPNGIHSRQTGQFSGSADDLSDGFIHLSTKEQVAGVDRKVFCKGKRPLYMAEFSGPDFLKLSWEASASDEIYPHFYEFDLIFDQISDLVIVQN